MTESKTYLGDGAYAEFDGHGIALTAENGITATDRVYLEPGVIAAFLRFLGKHYDRERLRGHVGEPGSTCPHCGSRRLVRLESLMHGPSRAKCLDCRKMWSIEVGAFADVYARRLTLDNDTSLSNKDCPRHYSKFEDGKRVEDRRCGCPEGRCWYDEQMTRRWAGKPAIATEFWPEEAGMLEDEKESIPFHICVTSIGLEELTRKQQRDRVRVARLIAEAGRFSVFEATSSKEIARTIDAIGEAGWFVFDESIGYPWVKVTLTDEGRKALGIEQEKESSDGGANQGDAG